MSRRLASGAFALLFATLAPSALGASDALPAEVTISGVEFVRIPAGEFWYSVEMKYPNQRKWGEPVFRDVRVWLDDYFIAKYEGRAADFVRFMNAGVVSSDLIGDDEIRTAEGDGCAIGFEPGRGYYERYPTVDLPATAVTGELAEAFAAWMGFRLPTEAEWQKAARGPDKRIWPWGNTYPDDTMASFLFGTGCAPSPVTAYPRGVSPHGVYNMAGNVGEWTSTWYNLDFDRSLRGGIRQPTEPSQAVINDEITRPYRIFKGGRWSNVPGSIAIAARELANMAAFTSSSGVRFAIDASRVRSLLSADSEALK